jgi:hypothetical protein
MGDIYSRRLLHSRIRSQEMSSSVDLEVAHIIHSNSGKNSRGGYAPRERRLREGALSISLSTYAELRQDGLLTSILLMGDIYSRRLLHSRIRSQEMSSSVDLEVAHIIHSNSGKNSRGGYAPRERRLREGALSISLSTYAELRKDGLLTSILLMGVGLFLGTFSNPPRESCQRPADHPLIVR